MGIKAAVKMWSQVKSQPTSRSICNHQPMFSMLGHNSVRTLSTMNSSSSMISNSDCHPFSYNSTSGASHQDDLLSQLNNMPELSAINHDPRIPYQDSFITDYYRQCKPFTTNIGFNYNDFPNMFCRDNDAQNNGPSKIRRRRKVEVPKPVIRERQLRRNERERARQNRLNSAFDVLRDALPSYLAPYKNGQKLTQIETLRLAKHYILCLKATLEEADETEGCETN